MVQYVAELRDRICRVRPTALTLIDRDPGLIERRYHATHRRELPELLKLARRVEAVHKDHPAVPAGLTEVLQTVATELEDHMGKEEQILFPLMRPR